MFWASSQLVASFALWVHVHQTCSRGKGENRLAGKTKHRNQESTSVIYMSYTNDWSPIWGLRWQIDPNESDWWQVGLASFHLSSKSLTQHHLG